MAVRQKRKRRQFPLGCRGPAAAAPVWTWTGLRAELTVVLRVGAKVTPVEDPRAPLPHRILRWSLPELPPSTRLLSASSCLSPLRAFGWGLDWRSPQQLHILCSPSSPISLFPSPAEAGQPSCPCLPGQWAASAAILWDLHGAVITSGTQALGSLYRWHAELGQGWWGLGGDWVWASADNVEEDNVVARERILRNCTSRKHFISRLESFHGAE